MSTKNSRVQARISQRLRERFDAALEYEGITESDFLNQKVLEFVEEVERKMATHPVQKIAGKKVDIDPDILEARGLRAAVEAAVRDLLVENGVEYDDIDQVRVEEEYHVKTDETWLGEVITKPEAFQLYVEIGGQSAMVIVDKDNTVRV